MRPAIIDKATLRIRIEVAWRMSATKRQVAEFEERSL
jgi:hypothetical protein